MWHLFESASGDSSSCDENAGPGREGHVQKADDVFAQSIFATWCCVGHNTRFRSMLGSTRWCIFYLLCKVFWHPFVSFISSLVCLFVCLFLLPASLMTRWNSRFLHTWHMGRVGGGWGGDDDVSLAVLAHMSHATDLTFLGLAHMWHATQVMGRVGWVGWGWWRFFHLHTCDMLRKWWAGLGGWGGDDDVRDTGFFDSFRRGCTAHADGNKAWNLALKCSLQSGTLKLDWQGLKR